jgi:hypothetical protein
MGEERMTKPVPSDRRLGPRFERERKQQGPVEVRSLWSWCRRRERMRRCFEEEEWSSKVTMSQQRRKEIESCHDEITTSYCTRML